jgi:signal transduction histidine kinase
VTAAPGAARTTRRRGAPTPIARDMETMIHRLLAGYAVVGLLPAVPGFLEQQAAYPWPWSAAVIGIGTVVVVAMVALSALGRPVGRWLLVFAVYTLLAVWSMALFTGAGAYPFLWSHVGLAVVCACVWRDVWLGAVYGLALGLGWAVLRLSPAGGSVDVVEAVVEGVFGVSAGLVIGVVALGMLSAARSADQLAARLREQGVRQAVERAVADERARLDQLIHDDVMTTLTAAVQDTDVATEAATARLARETLATIDALADAEGSGSLAVSVLADLAGQTVRRVSPDVGWSVTTEPRTAALQVPGPVAQTMLSALREAVRNAVRHSRASTVAVELRVTGDGDALALLVRVSDDGRGFDTERLPQDRLGVRVSMLLASHQAGLTTRLRSRLGHGTVFELRWSGRSEAVDRLVVVPEDDDPRLPVDFPAHRFSAVTWFALVINLALGLTALDRFVAVWPVVVAMVLAVLATAVVLRPGAGLRLRRTDAAVVVAAVAGVHGFMLLALPRPAMGIFVWHGFVMQLVLVTLVVRRRPGWALLGLAASETATALLAFGGPDGWAGMLAWGTGPLLFVVMAVLVNRVLLAITRRQHALRREEDEAIDASVRQHVARVQRSLWVADLRTQARSILLRLTEVRGTVPPELRREALLLEATLRESLVARNVMSDELADLTEAARRRGVDVRLVDSRTTLVPPRIAQAVLEVVRRALAVDSVSRLVVRLAPEDGTTAASVLSEDADGTHLVRLDASGTPVAQELARG